jgi:hypothetical protein
MRIGAEAGQHAQHQHNNHKGHNPSDTAVFPGRLQYRVYLLLKA